MVQAAYGPDLFPRTQFQKFKKRNPTCALSLIIITDL